MKKVVFSLLAAILLPTIGMAAWYLYGQFLSFEADDPYIWVRTRSFMLICLFIASAHVVFLGLPAFLVLRKINAIRWWSTVATGFLMACIPIAVWAWPLKYPELKSNSSHWDGQKMVQTMIDGVPTMEGWLSYGSGVLFMGAFGAIGGLAFWLVLHRHEPQPTVQADRPASGGCAA